VAQRVKVVTYSYDDLDRLIGETRTNSRGGTISQEQIAYDLVGNRISKTRDGIVVVYTNEYNRMAGWSVTQANHTVHMDVLGSANETIGTDPALGRLFVSNYVASTPSVDTSNFWAYDLTMSLGTQKVVAAVGDVAGNLRRIRTFLERVREASADLVVFPELSIPGYPPKDLLLKPRFIVDNVEAVRSLAAETAPGPAVLVGFVRESLCESVSALLPPRRAPVPVWRSALP
jgi:hypothetical protein